ncbi:MAG: patatin-like phospholipase family protein [Bacteroidales bacterium]|nr:patatin-like phospholipase family protein [Bacteroidales bacterium]
MVLKKIQKNQGVALAFGGGGARGFAHIGVLQVLEEEKIQIKAISGCSMGAVVGGLYAYYQDVSKVEAFLLTMIKKPAFKDLNLELFSSSKKKIKRNFTFDFNRYIQRYYNYYKTIKNTSMVAKEVLDEILEDFPKVKIEELPIPFIANATDLISGQEFLLKKGFLKNAVRASSSIPAVFPPVKRKNLLLVDGGVTDLIPIRPLKVKYKYPVIGVDVESSILGKNYFPNGLQILWRVQEIQFHHLAYERKKEADIIIRPDIRNFTWADVDLMDKFIAEGRKATLEIIDEIKKLLI